MKKTTVAALALCLAAAAAFSQSPVVLIQNQDSSTFYYAIDPQGLEGLSAGSPLMASKVAGFFSASGDAGFAALAPDDKARITSLGPGLHLLVGFFAVAEEEEFPVRVVSIQADASIAERFYAIFASPAQLTVARGVGKLAGFARAGKPAAQAASAQTQGVVQAAAPAGTRTGDQAAQHPVQTASAPAASAGSAAAQAAPRAPLMAIKSFSESFDPGTFTREKAGELTPLPIAQSRAWGLTGTEIASLAGSRDAEGVRLSLTVPGGFSPNVSYFLYAFTGRMIGRENTATLELVPRALGEKGACLLWRKGEAHPRVIGEVSETLSSVELDIGAMELQDAIQAPVDSDVTLDLTAAWRDAGLSVWEEFYYTTFPLPKPATR
jgi:hypothetical protein